MTSAPETAEQQDIVIRGHGGNSTSVLGYITAQYKSLLTYTYTDVLVCNKETSANARTTVHSAFYPLYLHALQPVCAGSIFCQKTFQQKPKSIYLNAINHMIRIKKKTCS